jgi:hypothetical protein
LAAFCRRYGNASIEELQWHLEERGQEMNARLFAVTIALTACCAAAASAQNLLANPHFDTALSGWQTQLFQQPALTTTWDGTRDADGSPSSGSAKVVYTYGAPTALVPFMSQCVATTSGIPYQLSGKVFIPGGQTGSGGGLVGVVFYPTPDCSGAPPPIGFSGTPPVTTLNAWTETAATFGSYGGSALVTAYLDAQGSGTLSANFDDLVLRPAAANCVLDDITLCLLGGRFRVTATYDAGNGNAGNAHVMALTGDSAYLWFFGPANVEAVVKVIDGCALGGQFWFFAGGLTNVAVVITVTDSMYGAVQTYSNPGGTPFAPIQDTSAFRCP